MRRPGHEGGFWARRWQGLRAIAVMGCLGASLAACSGQSGAPGAPGVSRTGYITISGGIKLAYDLTLPAGTGRFPVALEYNHYSAGADNSTEVAGSDAGLLLAAGFAVLGVNQPGSGCSGGVNNVADLTEWGQAGAQVVEWAAAQSWSTGHVGMFGSSWTGISQLGIASFRPKGLDAIAPFHVAADFYRDVAYPGGVHNAAFLSYYSKYLVQADAQAAREAIGRGNKQCSTDYHAHVIADRRYSLSPNASAHPFDNAYWQNDPANSVGRIDVPVLGCQSWQDGVVSSRATELYYNGFNPATTWFIGMNGGHGSCEFSDPLAMMVSFFQHYVAGARNGWQRTPHVTILHQVSGGITTAPVVAWTSQYSSWSQVMKPVSLYFGENGTLVAGPVSGADGIAGRSAGQASFSGPTPSQSGRWTRSPAPGTSVSYTTAPLAHDVDFFGPASVNLWLSSTAPDSDIEVILSEVRPDGMDQYVQAGWLDVADRRLAPAGSGPDQSSALRPYQTDLPGGRQPLVPGKPVFARVELLPFEHVFRAGSSIRITIDSAMGPVQSTGLWGLTGSTAPFRDTICASPSLQSSVTLGLIPGATAKAPLPACGSLVGEPCRRNALPVPHGRLTVPGS